jgi:hypothetical protein
MAENPEELAHLEEKSKAFDRSLLDKDPATLTPEETLAIRDNSKVQHAIQTRLREKTFDPITGKPYKDILAEERANYKVTNPPPKAPDEEFNKLKETVTDLTTIEEKRRFGYANQLSPEATDELFGYAKGHNLKPDEALKKPHVKALLESVSANAKANGVTPSPSSRTPVVDGKTFQEMTPAERQKNFGKVVEGITGKRA